MPTEAHQAPAEAVTAGQFVADELPPVNDAAVKSAETPPPTDPVPVADPADCDAGGAAFDPAKHIRVKHPKTGRWMPRRTKGTAAVAASYLAPDVPPPPPTDPISEYRFAAESACAVTFTVGMILGGEEWQPNAAEHASLLQAYEAYLKTKGVKDIPPGLALAIALANYAGPRLFMPKTQTRFQRIRAWFAGWKTSRAGQRAAESLASTSPQ